MPAVSSIFHWPTAPPSGRASVGATSATASGSVTVAVRLLASVAERSLRHTMIWRKLSFGTQSARSSRFVETMPTVIETCRQQRHNAFAFITNAVQAHLSHHSTPSLLPGV